MMTKEDLENAKKAFDHAWAEAARYADEALEAMRMHEQVQARDTDGIFWEKSKRALAAHENWRKAAMLAAKVMGEYTDPIRPKV